MCFTKQDIGIFVIFDIIFKYWRGKCYKKHSKLLFVELLSKVTNLTAIVWKITPAVK